jgi:hypothetical protein
LRFELPFISFNKKNSDAFITNFFISVVRLGKCRKKGVAEDAVKEGKGDLAWSSAVTAAPKYLEIKQRE